MQNCCEFTHKFSHLQFGNVNIWIWCGIIVCAGVNSGRNILWSGTYAKSCLLLFILSEKDVIFAK